MASYAGVGELYGTSEIFFSKKRGNYDDNELAFQFTEYLSDVGAHMSVWLGMSVISVVELLQIIPLLTEKIQKQFLKRRPRRTASTVSYD